MYWLRPLTQEQASPDQQLSGNIRRKNRTIVRQEQARRSPVSSLLAGTHAIAPVRIVSRGKLLYSVDIQSCAGGWQQRRRHSMDEMSAEFRPIWTNSLTTRRL